MTTDPAELDAGRALAQSLQLEPLALEGGRFRRTFTGGGISAILYMLIGSDFSNWLARLFLRMAKRKRLSDPRDFSEVFADDHTMKDDRLVAFLQQVSVRTRVYGGAEAFVSELHARWLRRQPVASPSTDSAGNAPQRFLPPSREMP